MKRRGLTGAVFGLLAAAFFIAACAHFLTRDVETDAAAEKAPRGFNGIIESHARDQFKHEPWYQLTVDFCAKYDEVSFDPAYPNEPMSTFAPMVRRVLNKPWTPPGKAE